MIMMRRVTLSAIALVLVCAAAMAATWSHASPPSTAMSIDPYAIQSQLNMRAMPDQVLFWNNF